MRAPQARRKDVGLIAIRTSVVLLISLVVIAVPAVAAPAPVGPGTRISDDGAIAIQHWTRHVDPTSVDRHHDFYVALGDSMAAADGAASYPFVIGARLGFAARRVVDYACSGETTTSMVSGPPCAPIGGRPRGSSQLEEATQFLSTHRGAVAFVTIGIGANDFLNACVNPAPVPTGCIPTIEQQIGSNISAILAALRAAAGANTPIIAVNYYDPFMGDWLAGGSHRQFALESLNDLLAFNAFLAHVYQQLGDPVANVENVFAMHSTDRMTVSPWGRIPLPVARACTFLDIGCRVGRPQGGGSDPIDRGARAIASAIEPTISMQLS